MRSGSGISSFTPLWRHLSQYPELRTAAICAIVWISLLCIRKRRNSLKSESRGKKEGSGGVELRIASFAGNSERLSLVRCRPQVVVQGKTCVIFWRVATGAIYTPSLPWGGASADEILSTTARRERLPNHFVRDEKAPGTSKFSGSPKTPALCRAQRQKPATKAFSRRPSKR
ncbi:hypothetical protein EVAR_42052_1 [Eumeta japonica]|uniref:Uncharacterized protein n=1 Tax=Eumeta variegata TaxID=151549 RepID=A0A4C1XVR4_EUMVA|nr:hypothetical protein EVAR_42052_1 [Eumeta japonica]